MVDLRTYRHKDFNKNTKTAVDSRHGVINNAIEPESCRAMLMHTRSLVRLCSWLDYIDSN